MAGKRIGSSAYENFTVTLENDRRVWIDGCIAVPVYEYEHVVVRLKSRNLHITGRALTLESFGHGELCVSGRIEGVSLEERR